MLFSFEISYKVTHVFKIDKPTLFFIPCIMTVIHTSFLIHSTIYIYIVYIKIKEPILTNGFFPFLDDRCFHPTKGFIKQITLIFILFSTLDILYFLFLVLLKQLMLSLFLSKLNEIFIHYR